MTDAQPKEQRSILRLVLVVVGGWVLTTIGSGLLISAMGHEAPAITLGGLLTTVWYVAMAFEGYRWWLAGRTQPALPDHTSAAPGRGRKGWPWFGFASLACPILVWLWVDEVFYEPYSGPGGESALTGFFAAGLLCVVALIVGVASAGASLYTKERRWLGILGLVTNVATAASLAFLVDRAS